jgi:hypothetical protein
MSNLRIEMSTTTTPDVTAYYGTQISKAQASAAAANASAASAATASALQVSAAKASAAQEFVAQKLGLEATTLKASAATASAAQAAAAQASNAVASAAAGLVSMGNDPANGKYVASSNSLDQTIPVEYSARYVRIRPSTAGGDGFITLSQIVVTDDFGNNLAKEANVYATSAKAAAKSAPVVVDGNTTSRTAANSWNAATSNRATEFIEVDLGSVQAISSIRLLGPSDCPPNNPKCADRMMNLRIEMSTSTTPEVTTYYTTQGSKTQASAAAASAATASAAIASTLQASTAVASAAQVATAQAAALQASVATASTATASAAAASAAQASAATQSAAVASTAQASAATQSAAAGLLNMGSDAVNGKFISPSNALDQTIITNYSARYVRIRPSTSTADGFIHLSQIMVVDDFANNMAVGANVYATSVMPAGKPASVVIDGTAITRTGANV